MRSQPKHCKDPGTHTHTQRDKHVCMKTMSKRCAAKLIECEAEKFVEKPKENHHLNMREK